MHTTLKPTILHLSEIDSTNNYASKLLARHKPDEGTLIVADWQTKGRGTESNAWESEKGKNLTFSLILYPPFEADKQFLLNKTISLGIHDFLKSILPNQSISIKWPNDIYVGDKKICGILIQNSISGYNFEYVVVGIGLNVNQMHFNSDAPNPISMAQIANKPFNLSDTIQSLFQFIASRYTQICMNDYLTIDNDYHKALYRINNWYTFSYKDTTMNACIRGTNEFGQLILETESKKNIVCDFKEIKFII